MIATLSSKIETNAQQTESDVRLKTMTCVDFYRDGNSESFNEGMQTYAKENC